MKSELGDSVVDSWFSPYDDVHVVCTQVRFGIGWELNSRFAENSLQNGGMCRSRTCALHENEESRPFFSFIGCLGDSCGEPSRSLERFIDLFGKRAPFGIAANTADTNQSFRRSSTQKCH